MSKFFLIILALLFFSLCINYSINDTIVDRFIRYVKIETTSNDKSPSSPSTPGQVELASILKTELLSLGLQEVELTEHGYLFGTLPSNTNKPNVPTIGFVAHLDTSADVSGKNVKPIIHQSYKGGNLIHPETKKIIVEESKNPFLKKCVGKSIITSSGDTLLGADNKAGIAAIIDGLEYLIKHPEIKHGKIKVAFTPDEEIGRGTLHFNVSKFGAKYGYTIDGGEIGEIENETFNAKKATITFNGVAAHTGSAKGILINSVKIAANFIGSLPREKLSPETTDGRDGFIHCGWMEATVEKTVVTCILRDFDQQKLKNHENLLNKIAENAARTFGTPVDISVQEQYRNMKEIIDQHPIVMNIAKTAASKIGVPPKIAYVRGGTDGAALSFKGLPCPNIFAGGKNFHSASEYLVIEDMKKASEMVVKISQLFEEDG
jgi:tripeptide aminopeptidase